MVSCHGRSIETLEHMKSATPRSSRMSHLAIVMGEGVAAAVLAIFLPNALWICGLGILCLIVLVTLVRARTAADQPSWLRRDADPQLTSGETLLSMSAVVLVLVPLIVTGVRGFLRP